MATDALSKAIKKEEGRTKRDALERREVKYSEATVACAGSSVVGIIAGAVHDKLRGKTSLPKDDDYAPGKQHVAKLGPIPANLALGAIGVGVGYMIPKKANVARSIVGGGSLGLALAGAYRLTYDNWPDSDPDNEDEDE